MTPEEAAVTLGATLAQAGVGASTVAPGETITRPVRGADVARAAAGTSGLASLPFLALRLDGGDDDLRVTGEIARGGMGVVHSAEQRSLGREVAVKRSLDATSTEALLHEARILGSLEHPNLVPVHALGVSREGRAVLVMKRVSGVPWSALLADASHAAWTPLVAGHGEHLRANLEILGQVCRALAFAHESGVVHRDLKPANVMIGRFGEVYLLDWGVAMRLSDRASEPRTIVGTPAYMPPEMARGSPELIDARTDVYLLGATLYEVLAGRPPNEAPTTLAALTLALLGTPPPDPEHAPASLLALVRRAMAVDPGARPPSVDAFRLELAAFLRSLDAERVATASRASIARAEELLLREGPASPDAHRALVEGRFGLASALEGRPDDHSLRVELDACVVRLVEREIAIGSVAGARSMLAQVSAPKPELSTAIDRLEAAERATREAAEHYERGRREADTSVGGSAMRIGLLAAAATFPICAAFAWRVLETGGAYEDLVIGNAMLATIAFGTLAIFRKRALATAASRRITWILAAWTGVCMASDVVTWASGGTVTQAAMHSLATAATIHGMGAAVVLRELWPLVLVDLVALVAAIAFPAGASGAVVGALLVNIVLFVRALRASAERTRFEPAPTP